MPIRRDAYERLIDRLLASPGYGERRGRHWLDGAGYADTHGGDNDLGTIKENKDIWKYRDYVVRSLNADKPFDRFITEQLAGDEAVEWRNAASYKPATLEKLVATGFLRHGSRRHQRGRAEPAARAERNRGAGDGIGREQLAGADVSVRSLPQPQVRPGDAGRLLPAARVLHAGV